MSSEPTLLSPVSAEDFAAYYLFRWQMLRAPWQQPPGSEQDECDADAHHVMLKQADNIIAVGRLHVVATDSAQIRYMAVADKFQRKGHGKSILDALETVARQMQIQSIILDARESATGFYEANGYKVIAPVHTLYNVIKHVRMEKILI